MRSGDGKAARDADQTTRGCEEREASFEVERGTSRSREGLALFLTLCQAQRPACLLASSCLRADRKWVVVRRRKLKTARKNRKARSFLLKFLISASHFNGGTARGGRILSAISLLATRRRNS